jgi:hypothetical protein
MKDIIVIDDFYENPLAVRNLALKAKYYPPQTLSPNYAGMESCRCYYSGALIEKFEEIVGNKIEVDLGKNVFGRFRSSAESCPRSTLVHIDDAEWSAVVYLSLDKDCQGGTAFYKHKETALWGPPDAECLKKLGLCSVGEFEEKVVRKDSLDESKWERDVFVAMKFNRLLLFRGSQRFHGYPLFNGSLEKARLTQLFFFNTIPSLNMLGAEETK